RSGFVRIGELVDSGYQMIETLQAQRGLVTGVPSGLVDLDEMTSGFQKSELIIVAARPAMGKTSFVLNIAMNAATQYHKSIAFFRLEMSKKYLIRRLLIS